MDRDEAKRTEIENHIIELWRDIQIKQRSERDIYIDLDRLEDFMGECQNLVNYYREHMDTVIGVEIVNMYTKFTRYLEWLKTETKNESIRERAEEWLLEIEVWIDDITAEAARNRDHLHSDD